MQRLADGADGDRLLTGPLVLGRGRVGKLQLGCGVSVLISD
ncbi:MAG: hypothetical protein ACXVFO_17225 [Solirubrobacteraceae bacterium]